MNKKLFIDYVKTVLFTGGLILISLLVLSTVLSHIELCIEHQLFFYEHIIRDVKCVMIVVSIVSLFEVFVEGLELLSEHKWIRRMIIIFVAIATMLIGFYLFGILSPFPTPLIIGLIIFFVVGSVISSVFGYVMQDKLRKQEITEINKKLNEISKKV